MELVKMAHLDADHPNGWAARSAMKLAKKLWAPLDANVPWSWDTSKWAFLMQWIEAQLANRKHGPGSGMVFDWLCYLAGSPWENVILGLDHRPEMPTAEWKDNVVATKSSSPTRKTGWVVLAFVLQIWWRVDPSLFENTALDITDAIVRPAAEDPDSWLEEWCGSPDAKSLELAERWTADHPMAVCELDALLALFHSLWHCPHVELGLESREIGWGLKHRTSRSIEKGTDLCACYGLQRFWFSPLWPNVDATWKVGSVDVQWQDDIEHGDVVEIQVPVQDWEFVDTSNPKSTPVTLDHSKVCGQAGCNRVVMINVSSHMVPNHHSTEEVKDPIEDGEYLPVPHLASGRLYLANAFCPIQDKKVCKNSDPPGYPGFAFTPSGEIKAKRGGNVMAGSWVRVHYIQQEDFRFPKQMEQWNNIVCSGCRSRNGKGKHR
jgi:hypothetical protein